MSETKEQPYLYTQRVVTDRHYNCDYGDARLCECGHRYDRHFDSYEDMEPVGCKYCPCGDFVEGASQVGTTCTIEGCTGTLAKRLEHRADSELECTVCNKQHHAFKRGLDHPGWLDEWRAKQSEHQ